MRVVLIGLGQVWTSPNTLLGLLAGLAAMPFGARPYFAGCAVAFRDMPRARGAVTLGAVILHGGCSLEAMVPTYAARHSPATCMDRVCLADHERAHVLQYLALGPAFLPAYFLCGGVSARNRFERAADRYALTGRGWWPFG